MFPSLEVWVGEAEEDGGEGGCGKEVGEEFHGVGAEDGDILVAAGEQARGRGLCWDGEVWLWWWYCCRGWLDVIGRRFRYR